MTGSLKGWMQVWKLCQMRSCAVCWRTSLCQVGRTAAIMHNSVSCRSCWLCY